MLQAKELRKFIKFGVMSVRIFAGIYLTEREEVMTKIKSIGIVLILALIVIAVVYFMFGAVDTKESAKSGVFVKNTEAVYRDMV